MFRIIYLFTCLEFNFVLARQVQREVAAPPCIHNIYMQSRAKSPLGFRQLSLNFHGPENLCSSNWSLMGSPLSQSGNKSIAGCWAVSRLSSYYILLKMSTMCQTLSETYSYLSDVGLCLDREHPGLAWPGCYTIFSRGAQADNQWETTEKMGHCCGSLLVTHSPQYTPN